MCVCVFNVYKVCIIPIEGVCWIYGKIVRVNIMWISESFWL